MSDEDLRKAALACHVAQWEDERWEDVALVVQADPESTWRALRDWIDSAETPDEAEQFDCVLRTLIGLDPVWQDKVASAARDDGKLASVLAEAISLEPDLKRTMIDRAVLVETWVRYDASEDPWDEWASMMVINAVTWLDFDQRWQLILDLATAAADDPDALSMVGVIPVEDLLRDDWPTAIDFIERDAPQHEPLRRSLWSVWRLEDVPDEIIERVHQAAQQAPGTPHRY